MGVDIRETRETVKNYIEEQGVSFTNLLDEKGYVSELYSVRSHPTKFLIGNKGDLLGFAPGYREWDTDEVKALIDLLMK